ncbi:MAG: redoxin domain-containing protein, partial [Bacteroidetes bacterium]|nr:redoxin domain-containing protein [Bacteroidota bacterium]
MPFIKYCLSLFFLLAQIFLHAQIPNGSVAPDFTLTDYDGNVHRLYDYLNSGKTVILEVFAAHCPVCWSYHQTHKLKDLYNNYGPSGTDELVVLALEYDQWNNHNAFIGIGDPWVTQGNWLDGTPYPIFNVEDPDRGVFEDYNINGYPKVFKICPDKLSEIISTSLSVEQIYAKVQQCETVLGVSNKQEAKDFSFNSLNNTVILKNYNKDWTFQLFSLNGRLIQENKISNSDFVTVNEMSPGVYVFKIISESDVIYK